MAGSRHFRLRVDHFVGDDGDEHFQARGRFEIRGTDPSDPSRSCFLPPVWFLFDTGAELSVVSESFARMCGLGNYRRDGRRIAIRGYDDHTPSRIAWLVPRWVRFRDYRTRRVTGAGDTGGLPDLEFRINFAVVEGARVELPILGLADFHALFNLASKRQEFWCFLAVDDDGIPHAPDRVRTTRPLT